MVREGHTSDAPSKQEQHIVCTQPVRETGTHICLPKERRPDVSLSILH